MKETPWYQSEAFKSIVKQVIIALLVALLSVLGYDKVILPTRLNDAEPIVITRATLPGDPPGIHFSYCRDGCGCIDVHIK